MVDFLDNFLELLRIICKHNRPVHKNACSIIFCERYQAFPISIETRQHCVFPGQRVPFSTIGRSVSSFRYIALVLSSLQHAVIVSWTLLITFFRAISSLHNFSNRRFSLWLQHPSSGNCIFLEIDWLVELLSTITHTAHLRIFVL